MWGLRTVRGVFGAYDGSLKVQAGAATGELTIEADSLDTGNARRDRHLRSPAFFDVERHPRIVFTATAITTRSGHVGELAIGPSRVRLEIPATSSTGRRRAGLEGTTTVSREATGLAWNMLGMIRGEALLQIRLALKP